MYVSELCYVNYVICTVYSIPRLRECFKLHLYCTDVCSCECDIHCIQGCQLSSTGDVWGLGTLASTNITATSMPDGRWALTALYSNPEQGKRFTVYYTVEPSGSAPEFQFVTETPSSIVSHVHDQQSPRLN